MTQIENSVLIHLITVCGVILCLILLLSIIKYTIDCACFRQVPTSTNVYIKQSKVGGTYGRGVFANKDFEEDEIIEISPYIEDDVKNMKGIVGDYVFSHNNKAILVLGYASLCNHSDDMNATWYINDYNYILKALRTIKKDEEIFISYGSSYWTSRNIEKK